MECLYHKNTFEQIKKTAQEVQNKIKKISCSETGYLHTEFHPLMTHKDLRKKLDSEGVFSRENSSSRFESNSKKINIIKNLMRDENTGKEFGKIIGERDDCFSDLEIKDDYSQEENALISAENIIKTIDEDLFDCYNTLVKKVYHVKQEKEGIFPIQSLSDSRLYGAVFASFTHIDKPFFNVEMAKTLIHEFAHQYLFTLQSFDPLVKEEFSHREYYSPIKLRSRPAISVLHALTALFFMNVSTKKYLERVNASQAEKNFLEERMNYEAKHARESVESFGDDISVFSDIGRKIFLDVYLYFKKGE